MDDWLKRYLLFLLIFLAGFILIKYFFIYFSPFIIAAIIASLINPVVDWVEALLPVNRGIAVFIVLVLLIFILVVFIIVGVSQVYLELNRLLNNLPDYSSIGRQFQWIVNQNNKVEEFINSLEISLPVKEALNNNLQLIYNAIKSGLVRVINSILNTLGKLPMIMTILFLSFIAAFFISRDKDDINSYILNLFPGEWKIKVFELEKELVSSAIGFVRAEIILISISGLIAGVGLAIIGNPYALIIGITSAFLDLIPIIGPSLIFIPWIIINIFFGNINLGLKLLIVYTSMAAIRQGAEGKIMGTNLGIHPLMTMVALYVGYRTMGTIGFIIGPSILVITKAIFRAGFINIKE